MDEGWISVLTGLLTLIGVCFTAWTGAKKTRDEVGQRLETAQAVTDCKLELLTAEVRRHNEFARRMPALEAGLNALEQRVDRLAGGTEVRK